MTTLSTPAARTVAGWKLVPIEPTEQMMDAAIATVEKPCSPQDIFAAMLAAAPSPEALPDVTEAVLTDPVAVHRSMLAGAIAKPSLMNLAHLYPEVQQMRQALIATLKHFRWPTSAEHQTRDQVISALAPFDDLPMIPAALSSAPAPAPAQSGVLEDAAQAALARIRKLRNGYADQAKFADVDEARLFRQFVDRLDRAALAPANKAEGERP